MHKAFCCDCGPNSAGGAVISDYDQRPVRDTPKAYKELSEVCSCRSGATNSPVSSHKRTPPSAQRASIRESSATCSCSSPAKSQRVSIYSSKTCSCSVSPAQDSRRYSPEVESSSGECSCASSAREATPIECAAYQGSSRKSTPQSDGTCSCGSPVKPQRESLSDSSKSCSCAETPIKDDSQPSVPPSAKLSTPSCSCQSVSKASEPSNDQSSPSCSCGTTQLDEIIKPSVMVSSLSCSCESSRSKLPSVTCTCVTSVEKPQIVPSPICKCAYQTQPCPPDYSSLSLSSNDVNYFDTIKALSQEEKRLNRELEELRHKEATFARTMKLWNDMHASKDDEDEDESLNELRVLNQELTEKNNRLSGELEDKQLEMRQLQERVEGPLKRQLYRERRRIEDLESQFQRSQPDKSRLKEREILFLKEQIKQTNRTIRDLGEVNRGIKEEACVLTNKCDALQQLIIQQKKIEIKAIDELT